MDNRTDMQVIIDQLNEVISYVALLDQKPRKIKDYKLIDARDISGGISTIERNLENGWVLYGSPFVKDATIWQALIRYETSNNES